MADICPPIIVLSSIRGVFVFCGEMKNITYAQIIAFDFRITIYQYRSFVNPYNIIYMYMSVRLLRHVFVTESESAKDNIAMSIGNGQ